eukprot:gene26365-17458_t
MLQHKSFGIASGTRHFLPTTKASDLFPTRAALRSGRAGHLNPGRSGSFFGCGSMSNGNGSSGIGVVPTAGIPMPQFGVGSAALSSTEAPTSGGESVSLAELKMLCHKALATQGYSDKEIEILTDVMMYAQLRDNNQGIIKITSGAMKKNPLAKEPVIEKETLLSACINGNQTAGMIVLKQAVEMAVQRAQEQGFGIVGTNHTSSSTGAIG